MSLAELVITSVTVERRSKSEVARDYRISRYWVQTLVKRYEAEGEAAFVSRVKNLAGFRARESWVPRGLPGRGGPHGDGSRPGVRAA